MWPVEMWLNTRATVSSLLLLSSGMVIDFVVVSHVSLNVAATTNSAFLLPQTRYY